MERCALNVLQYLGADAARIIFAMTFKQPHDGDLARAAGSRDCCRATILVHETSEATDKSFVGFYFTLHLLETARLYRAPNPMIHEPRGFLRDAQIAGDFVTD